MKTKDDKIIVNKQNFVGGKLKLKMAITQKSANQSVNKLKQVIAKEKNSISSDIKEKNNLVSAFINDDEANYMKQMEENINKKSERPKGLLDDLTPSERLYYERKLNRLPEKISKNLQMTYKQKYENFNKSLSKLPVHNDIPKVGPG